MAKKTREELLKEKLNNINARSGGNNHFYKPGKDPEQIRMVPYPHGEEFQYSVEVGFHYNIAGIKSVVCPAETYGDACPICELAEVYRNKGGDDNWEIYKKIKAKIRTYSPVIVRNKGNAVKLWGYGSTIDTEIVKKNMNPDYNDLENAKAGHDLVVSTIPKNTPGNNSSYDKPEMDVRIKPTPLADSIAEMKEIIKSVPNILEDDGIFNKMDYDALCELVEKLGSEDMYSEPDELEEQFSLADSSSESNSGDTPEDASDDLDDKLKGLLD